MTYFQHDSEDILMLTHFRNLLMLKWGQKLANMFWKETYVQKREYTSAIATVLTFQQKEFDAPTTCTIILEYNHWYYENNA